MTTREIQYNEMPPLRQHDPTACRWCGLRIERHGTRHGHLGEEFCSATCAGFYASHYGMKTAPDTATPDDGECRRRTPAALTGTLVGPVTVTPPLCAEPKPKRRGRSSGVATKPGARDAHTPAFCPLRWCTREVRAHTEAEVARCAEYRGRLRVIEERLRDFQNSIARRFPDAADMPLSAAGEVVWAEKRTEEETEALRRQWRALEPDRTQGAP